MPAALHLPTLLFAVVLLAACAVAHPPNEILSPEMAMMYGYVEADSPIDAVDFHEFGVVYIPPFRVPPRVLVYKNGYFMAENLKPGKYYIAAIHSGDMTYKLVDSVQSSYQNVINIRPGSLTFIGSHRIVVRGINAQNQVDFEVARTRRPDERTLLNYFYDLTEGTAWQKKIARRMKELRQ